MSDETPPKKSKTHVILWIAASLFILFAIAGMWAADYYFSPEMLSPTIVPDAVGK